MHDVSPTDLQAAVTRVKVAAVALAAAIRAHSDAKCEHLGAKAALHALVGLDGIKDLGESRHGSDLGEFRMSLEHRGQ